MVTVPGVLATSGLNPYVGLGSMERLEHIRTHDPVLFEKIGLERDPLTLSGDAGQAAWILAPVPLQTWRQASSRTCR